MSKPRPMPPPLPGGPEHMERRGAECLEYVRARAMPRDPTSVVKFFDEFAYQNWMMNVGDVKGEIVDTEIAKAKPQVMIEIGGFCGYSAVRFASTLREVSGSSTRFYSFEFNAAFAGIATEMIKLAGLEEVVTITIGAFETTHKELRESLGVDHIDSLFIDHHKDLYLAGLKRGSVVVADNVITAGVADYLDYVRTYPNFSSVLHGSVVEYTDERDGVEVSVYGAATK